MSLLPGLLSLFSPTPHILRSGDWRLPLLPLGSGMQLWEPSDLWEKPSSLSFRACASSLFFNGPDLWTPPGILMPLNPQFLLPGMPSSAFTFLCQAASCPFNPIHNTCTSAESSLNPGHRAASFAPGLRAPRAPHSWFRLPPSTSTLLLPYIHIWSTYWTTPPRSSISWGPRQRCCQ